MPGTRGLMQWPPEQLQASLSHSVYRTSQHHLGYPLRGSDLDLKFFMRFRALEASSTPAHCVPGIPERVWTGCSVVPEASGIVHFLRNLSYDGMPR